MTDNQIGATTERFTPQAVSDGAITAQRDAGFNLSQAAMGLMEKGSLSNNSGNLDGSGNLTNGQLDLSGDIYKTTQNTTGADNIAQPGGEKVFKHPAASTPDKNDRPNVAESGDNSPKVLKHPAHSSHGSHAGADSTGREAIQTQGEAATGAIHPGNDLPNVAQPSDGSTTVKKTLESHATAHPAENQIIQGIKGN